MNAEGLRAQSAAHAPPPASAPTNHELYRLPRGRELELLLQVRSILKQKPIHRGSGVAAIGLHSSAPVGLQRTCGRLDAGRNPHRVATQITAALRETRFARGNRDSRFRQRAHLVRLKTSARNRMFGLLTQWGMRGNLKLLRQPGSLLQLAERGVPAVWLESLRVLLDVVDDLERQLETIDRELRPVGRADPRVAAAHDPGDR